MKKLTITGLILMLVGGICFVVAMAMLGWNFAALSARLIRNPITNRIEFLTYNDMINSDFTFDLVEDSIEYTDQNLIIDGSDIAVQILPSHDELIHYSYGINQEVDYEVTVGEDITITSLATYDIVKMDLYFGIGVNYEMPPLIVKIPQDFIGNVYVQTTNGAIQAKNVEVNSLSLDTTNAAVDIVDVNSKDNISISTTNGAINVEESTSDDFIVVTTNGVINVSETVSEEFSVETTNSLINSSKITATHIDLNTVTGGIILSILGDKDDYAIDSDFGEFVVANIESTPDEGKEKSLAISTTVGAVEVEFI